MGELILGLFLGANLGVVLMAILAINKDAKDKEYIRSFRSDCCDYVVEMEPAFRCLKCGHYCRVKDVNKEA